MEITVSYALLTIVAAIISGVAGVVISTVYYRRYEKLKVKTETAKRLIANRYDLTGEEFTRALNEVFIIFHDSKPVINALAEFHNVITTRQTSLSNDKLVKLFKEICKNVNIDYAAFNDSFFLQPFNTKPNSMA